MTRRLKSLRIWSVRKSGGMTDTPSYESVEEGRRCNVGRLFSAEASVSNGTTELRLNGTNAFSDIGAKVGIDRKPVK